MEKNSVMSGEIKSILKKVSRTLYLSVNILPEPARSLMGLGYLLCRAMDTVVDAPGVSTAGKLEILSLCRGLDTPGNAARLEELARKLAHLAAGPGEMELLQKFGKVLSLYERVPAHDKELFNPLLSKVAAGMEMDVKLFPGGKPAALPAAADLERYCALIGGAPGAFWARLYRETIRRANPAVAGLPSVDEAESIGAALQMTNVLKDIPADLRAGRCYLPQTDLDANNLRPEDLLDPAALPRIRETAGKWIAWALDRLDLSEAFLLTVPKTELALRAAVIWPVYWAMETLEAVAHSNLLDPADRPKIKRSRIYATIASTPPLLLSNTAFARGYRFRREMLIVSLTGGNYEGQAL
ncbi:MAG TPA: squalene/phytoene synthase family protein [Elusimicrobiales bacterium]|nr:squalene/phytoene synthase family protein [Elusimicrobiales bacterium]